MEFTAFLKVKKTKLKESLQAIFSHGTLKQNKTKKQTEELNKTN